MIRKEVKKKRFARDREIEAKRNFYVNGMNGSLLVFDEKYELTNFKLSGIEDPKSVMTIPTELKPDKEVLDGLRVADLKPVLNREDAVDKIRELLGARVNRQIIPSLCWYPVWQFTLRERDLNTLDVKWVEGVKGSFMQENPLK